MQTIPPNIFGVAIFDDAIAINAAADASLVVRQKNYTHSGHRAPLLPYLNECQHFETKQLEVKAGRGKLVLLFYDCLE